MSKASKKKPQPPKSESESESDSSSSSSSSSSAESSQKTSKSDSEESSQKSSSEEKDDSEIKDSCKTKGSVEKKKKSNSKQPIKKKPPPAKSMNNSKSAKNSKKPTSSSETKKATPKPPISSSESEKSDSEPEAAYPTVKLCEIQSFKFASFKLKDHSRVFEYLHKTRTGQVTSLELTRSDIARLRPGQFLNDNLINFYLRYLEQEVMSPELKEKVFVYNSFFYQKLKQTSAKTKEDVLKNYAGVRTWTKKVDIFTKDFLIIPMCEDAHWSLAVVCYPKAVFDYAIECAKDSNKPLPAKKTCVIIFSSLKIKTSATARVIKSYIQTEYIMEKMDSAHMDIFDNIDNYNEQFAHYVPIVPKQDNYYDCGVYVMQYAEEFLKKPHEYAQQIASGLDDFSGWFEDEYMKKKRVHLQAFLLQLILKKLGADLEPLKKEVEKEKELKRQKKEAEEAAEAEIKRKKAKKNHKRRCLSRREEEDIEMELEEELERELDGLGEKV